MVVPVTNSARCWVGLTQECPTHSRSGPNSRADANERTKILPFNNSLSFPLSKLPTIIEMSTLEIINSILANPAYHDYLAILKGARNGLVYGVKIRFPHALLMSILFGHGECVIAHAVDLSLPLPLTNAYFTCHFNILGCTHSHLVRCPEASKYSRQRRRMPLT